MVDIIKLKELGFEVDFLPSEEGKAHDHLVHQMFKGYKKFGEDYVHLLSDHVDHVLGVEDKEEFRRQLLQKAKNNEKDDVLHCALSIMSIHHHRNHHDSRGHGQSFHDANRVVISFMKNSPEKLQEMHDRFPHVTKDIVESIAPVAVREEMSA